MQLGWECVLNTHDARGCSQHLLKQQGSHTCNPSTQEVSSGSFLAKCEFRPLLGIHETLSRGRGRELSYFKKGTEE